MHWATASVGRLASTRATATVNLRPLISHPIDTAGSVDLLHPATAGTSVSVFRQFLNLRWTICSRMQRRMNARTSPTFGRRRP
jgi:hypothetical protein